MMNAETSILIQNCIGDAIDRLRKPLEDELYGIEGWDADRSEPLEGFEYDDFEYARRLEGEISALTNAEFEVWKEIARRL